MRVLHLGANSASQMDIAVAALNRIGVEARGLSFYTKSIQSGTNIEILSKGKPETSITGKLHERYRWWRIVSRAISWADVVHCYVGPRVFHFDLDLWYISRKRKGRLVEFLGSDIRTKTVVAADNPYLSRLLNGGRLRYTISDEASRTRQRRYSRYGFHCATSDPELIDCVMPDLFPSHYLLRARVDLSRFEPSYPNVARRRPILVHMPSNPLLKGTAAVLKAVEILKTRFDFEFRLLQGMAHEEALRHLNACDLLLDQFVIGTHGVASIEAMAFGKPVISYIKPSYICRLPSEFPIVAATQDNLAEVTAKLLAAPDRLRQVGRQSRAYVEKYHNAATIALQMREIYRELLSSKNL